MSDIGLSEMTLLLGPDVIAGAVGPGTGAVGPELEVVTRALAGDDFNGVLLPEVVVEAVTRLTDPSGPDAMSPADAWSAVDVLCAGLAIGVAGEGTLEVARDLAGDAGLAGADVREALVAAQVQGLGVDAVCTGEGDVLTRLGVAVMTPGDLLAAIEAEPNELAI